MSKILVTGGAGFIGSHVVDQLIANNQSVVVVDNLSTGFKANINPLAKFYNISIQDPNLENVFEIEKPEYVIHLAALTSVKESVANPVENAYINVLGSINLLEMCRRYQIKKFVFSSSAAVYSPLAEVPVKEDAELKPLSPYGISKLTLEYYLSYYLNEYQIPNVVLRYANVYGPRQRLGGESGVIAIFVNNLLRKMPIAINLDGQQTRDFIFVEDVARANVLSLQDNITGVFNIGTAKEIAIIDLFSALKKILNSPVEPSFNLSGYEHELKRSSLDYSRAREFLGFEPKTELALGLVKTCEWYQHKFWDKENNVWVIVPAYNEAKQIVNVIKELKKYVKNIVVVDDFSNDETVSLAQGEGVFVLRHYINRGQGAALQTGIDFALQNRAQIIVTFDADGQHQAEDIENLIRPILENEAQVTLGSRFLTNHPQGLPWLRRVILKLGILFTWIVSGLKLTDVHNGLRAFSSESAQKINIQQDRMAHASEILDQIAKKKIKYVEVPVTIKYSSYSRLKGQGSGNAIKIAGRIIYSKLFIK